MHTLVFWAPGHIDLHQWTAVDRTANKIQILVHNFRNDAKLNIFGIVPSISMEKCYHHAITIMPLVLWPFTSVNS